MKFKAIKVYTDLVWRHMYVDLNDSH